MPSTQVIFFNATKNLKQNAKQAFKLVNEQGFMAFIEYGTCGKGRVTLTHFPINSYFTSFKSSCSYFNFNEGPLEFELIKVVGWVKSYN